MGRRMDHKVGMRVRHRSDALHDCTCCYPCTVTSFNVHQLKIAKKSESDVTFLSHH